LDMGGGLGWGGGGRGWGWGWGWMEYREGGRGWGNRGGTVGIPLVDEERVLVCWA